MIHNFATKLQKFFWHIFAVEDALLLMTNSDATKQFFRRKCQIAVPDIRTIKRHHAQENILPDAARNLIGIAEFRDIAHIDVAKMAVHEIVGIARVLGVKNIKTKLAIFALRNVIATDVFRLENMRIFVRRHETNLLAEALLPGGETGKTARVEFSNFLKILNFAVGSI